ncbi:MAG: hypothetical protein Q8Q09_29190 [Deltaproteobacteria bacterium]|nr:hypothetical protein [Deltaproteobacteria bacterium]
MNDTMSLLGLAACVSGLLFSGCVSTNSRIQPVEVGELERAAPLQRGDGIANTESSASIVLGSLRTRVRLEVVDYLRAVLNDDETRLRTLFADNVSLIQNGEPYRTQEAIIAHHRVASHNYDHAFLRVQVEQGEMGFSVRSYDELRRATPTGLAAAQSGDWLVDLSFVRGAPTNSTARYLPAQMLFRSDGDGLRVVSISLISPLRM